MRNWLTLTALSLLLLGGCGSETTSVDSHKSPGGYVVMDSSGGDIPYPNNILFAGSTDGTLNIPYDPNAADAPISMALNTLDGFSTISPISVSVEGEMDPSTLPGNMHLYKVIAQASAATGGIPAVGAIERELIFGSEYIATFQGGKLLILPTVPLESRSSYMVVLTDGITNAQAQPLSADAVTAMLNQSAPLIDAEGNPTIYLNPDALTNTQSAMQLESLRRLTQAMFAQLIGQEGVQCLLTPAQAVDCSNVVMAWSFTTQTIGTTAAAIAEHNATAKLSVQNSGKTSKQMLTLAGFDTTSMNGNADIYVGTLADLPYYLGTPSSSNPTAPLNSRFSIENALPVQQSTQTVPVLMSVPNQTTMPANGWPVVIFQHGITQDRSNLLALAETFAAIGYASVAMDLPLHGITTAYNPLYMAGLERTFDLDLINNITGSPAPDGVIDASGAHYLNLAQLLVSRDNIRQSTSDLIALKNALASATGITLDGTQVAYVGHSLGAIVSFGFLAHATLDSVVLGMPGGGIAQLLNHSPAFGQEIRDGLLANAGIEPDSAQYNAFMLAAQTLLDDADSINYAADVAAKQKVLIIETIGNGTEGSGDQTIPNSIATAPLSGTEPLIRIMEAENVYTSQPETLPLANDAVSRLYNGSHYSLLLPDAATAEIHRQSASYIASKGTQVSVEEYFLLYDSSAQ